MVCYICGAPASLVCEKCNLYVCRNHFDNLKNKKYLYHFNSYIGMNLCHKCLEPLNCQICGDRSYNVCLNCHKFFCDAHKTDIEVEFINTDGYPQRGQFTYCFKCKSFGEVKARKDKEKCDNWRKHQDEKSLRDCRERDGLCCDCGKKLTFWNHNPSKNKYICRDCYKILCRKIYESNHPHGK